MEDTTNVNASSGSNLNFAIQLAPPDANLAAQFATGDNVKTKIFQDGQLIDTGTDTMQSISSTHTTDLNEAQQMQLGIGLGNAEKQLQYQLNHLSPGDPKIPVLTTELNIIHEVVSSGAVPADTLINLGINPTTGNLDSINVTSTRTAASATAATAAAKKTGVSGWFANNAYVTFETVFSNLVRQMMKNEYVQAQTAQKALGETYELALASSKDVLSSATDRAQQQLVSAIADFASAAVTIGGSLMSAKETNKMEVPQDEFIETTPSGVQPAGIAKGDSMTATRQEPVFEKDARNNEYHITDNAGNKVFSEPDRPVMRDTPNAEVINQIDGENVYGIRSPDGSVATEIPGKPFTAKTPGATRTQATNPDGTPQTATVTRPVRRTAQQIADKNKQIQASAQNWTSTASAIGSGFKSGSEIYAYIMTLDAGQHDADKVIVDYILKNIQEQQQKALEMIKNNQDGIDQVLQNLKSWCDALSQAQQAMMRK